MIHTNNAEALPSIGIIIGSTRPRRICPEIAQWALDIIQATHLVYGELVDLAAINLPFLDEPVMPALGQYQRKHTRAWSQRVSSYAGFVFVLPQYNWGYPAPLKNALDFLYHEWVGKAATLITYGNHGGGRAAAQLKVVLQGLHMKNTATNPELSIQESMFDSRGHFTDIAAAFAGYRADVQAATIELAALLHPVGS